MLALNQELRWKSITHLSEEEAARLLNELLKQRRSSVNEQPVRTHQEPKPPMQTGIQGMKILNLSGVPIRNDMKLDSKRQRPSSDVQQSFIRPFVKKQEKQNIKQEYLMLWYDKLAWQEHIDRLTRENLKKDEVIIRLRHELQQIRSSRRL